MLIVCNKESQINLFTCVPRCYKIKLFFFPFRFLPKFRNVLKLILDGQKETHEIYRKILEDHRQCPFGNSSFLSAYNEEMSQRQENGEPESSFTETQCFYLLADLYGAGVDTTLMTLLWFLLFMASSPNEQVRISTMIPNFFTSQHCLTIINFVMKFQLYSADTFQMKNTLQYIKIKYFLFIHKFFSKIVFSTLYSIA